MARFGTFKVVAVVLLAVTLAAPFLIGIWYLFPVVAVYGVWQLLRLSKIKSVAPYLKAMAIALAIVFLIWAFFFLKNARPPLESYRKSSIIPQATSPVSQSGSSGSVKQDFLDKASAARRRAQEAAFARSYYLASQRSLDYLYEHPTAANEKEPAQTTFTDELKGALKQLDEDINELRKNSPAPQQSSNNSNRLDAATLRSRADETVANINQLVATLEKEKFDPKAVQEANDFDLPTIENAQGLHKIWEDQQGVREAIERAAQNRISEPRSTCSVEYHRTSDELVSTQATTIDLGSSSAIQIDARHLFDSIDRPSPETIEVEVKPTGEHGTITSEQPVLHVSPQSKVITIIEKVTLPSESHPILYNPVPSEFKAIEVGWPLRPSRSVEITVSLFKGQSEARFPVLVAVKSGSDKIEKIDVPHNSFFYSDTFEKKEEAANQHEFDKLVPGTDAPTLTALYGGRKVTVELMPKYLSWAFPQKFKEYLVFENTITALIVALICAIVVAFFEV